MTLEQTLIFGAARAVIERRRDAHRIPYTATAIDIHFELAGRLSRCQIQQEMQIMARECPELMTVGHTLNDLFCALPHIGDDLPQQQTTNNKQ